MSKKRTTGNTRKSELPYNPNDRAEVLSFWKEATAHRGVAELRAKRGRPAKNPSERKEQICGWTLMFWPGTERRVVDGRQE